MRKSVLLYLFVFAALVALFQYVSAQNMLDSKNEEIEALKSELATAQKQCDSLKTLNQAYFSLDGNQEAISYFENRGFNASKIAQKIKDEIIGENKASQDNELVPYEGMEGYMRINKVKILNHKWILADFTDGSFWGELFLTYTIDDNGNLIINAENAFLYPKPEG